MAGTVHAEDVVPGSSLQDPSSGIPSFVVTNDTNGIDYEDSPTPQRVLPPNAVNIEAVTNFGHSQQVLAPDLTLGDSAGKDSPDSAFLASIMGNVMGDTLAKTGNYTAGVIGYYSITGTNASLFGKAGVMGIAGDGTISADAGVVSVLDGDGGGATTPLAMFKAWKFNSTANNNPQYGLDLLSAVSGFQPLVPTNADIRLANSVCVMQGAGAPTDGVTGDNFAGPGTLYIDTTNANAYIQSSLITTPVWKLITRAP